MFGTFGFSYVGLVYLLILWIPNVIWAKRRMSNYDPKIESKVLLVFERTGQVLCTGAILLFSNYNPQSLEPWLAWFVASGILMILYVVFWIRYFHSEMSSEDFYRPLIGIPVPGALLPVLAFLLLGIYGKVIWLILAALILGIGHVGIHLQHLKAMK